MTCPECERIQDDEKWSIPYRWGSANVFLIACEVHGKELIEALNAIQSLIEFVREKLET